ncbi:DUF6318 family protein [Pengzhenrongella frigida]|uniref:DUF6318 family protein n=1 Tax=Pengzhenrongella frigida TaxID=1259133 RepID=UPI003313028C
MDRDDAEGAIAAATYFISLYTYAFASGELDAWKAMSDPGCVFCSGLVSDIQTASDAGTRFTGGGLTVESSVAIPAEALNRFRIDLTVSQAPSETLDRSGSVTASSPGTGRATVTAVLEHSSEGWLVRAASTEVPQG